MAESPKARILDALSASRLRDLADRLGVGGSRRSKIEMIETFTRYRKLGADNLLSHLSRGELADLCRQFGLEDGARDKRTLIDRILETAPSRPAPVAKPATPPQQSVTKISMETTPTSPSSATIGFEAELFKAADKLRGNMEPSNGIH